LGAKRPHLRALAKELARRHPQLDDPEGLIVSGRVLVDGLVLTNPASLVRSDASIALRRARPLRGEAKLGSALARFAVPTSGRVALDVGAAAGGFTRALLAAGVERVYAVDVGHGQLLGSLRRNPRVVALERTNLAELRPALVPDALGIVVLDLSYLSIARAAPQLEALRFQRGADLVALVKPMFELELARPPTDPAQQRSAVERAARGLEAHDWDVIAWTRSPVTGARGAIEFFLHARRRE
jgi:23S rRNA (cytidine1920-2'-O)/16S rRNA (cytidine1409-2'-O)-methyltransferase